MSDYPEDLNPFKEKKLSRRFTRSFRDFKGFILKSFRRKRAKTDNNGEAVFVREPEASCSSIRTQVKSLPSTPSYVRLPSPALPRSRFKERLSRSSLNSNYNRFYNESQNPFNEEGVNPFDMPPIPYRRKKPKKRAPIPPSFSSSDADTFRGMRGPSKWSLTSSETDFTMDDKSELSGEGTYSQSLRDCLNMFNKEMGTLNNGTSEIEVHSPALLENKEEVQKKTDSLRKESIDTVDEETTSEMNNENDLANLNKNMNNLNEESFKNGVGSPTLLENNASQEETDKKKKLSIDSVDTTKINDKETEARNIELVTENVEAEIPKISDEQNNIAEESDIKTNTEHNTEYAESLHEEQICNEVIHISEAEKNGMNKTNDIKDNPKEQVNEEKNDSYDDVTDESDDDDDQSDYDYEYSIAEYLQYSAILEGEMENNEMEPEFLKDGIEFADDDSPPSDLTSTTDVDTQVAGPSRTKRIYKLDKEALLGETSLPK